mgnify:CR=1 FL=1
MTIILVCALYSGVSNLTLAIPNPPDPRYARQECAVYPTAKEAALARYEGQSGRENDAGRNFQQEVFGGDTYYRIDVETMKMEQIATPRVRLEVDEK